MNKLNDNGENLISIWHILEFIREKDRINGGVGTSRDEVRQHFQRHAYSLQKKLVSLHYKGFLKRGYVQRGIYPAVMVYFINEEMCNAYLDNFNITSFLDDKNPSISKMKYIAVKKGKSWTDSF